MPIDVGDLRVLVGPGIVIVVLLGIALFMRWAFSGPGSPEKRLRTRPPSEDDGLLTPVAAFSRREPALALRAVLSDAGIRSTIRLPAPRRAEVLVFPEDAERARVLAASFSDVLTSDDPVAALPDDDVPFPEGTADERELLLRWLRFLRGAVLRKAGGLTEEQARWRPDGRLLSLLGIVNHLTRVEWRWIDGGMLGRPTSRSEEEFAPGPELTLAAALAAYRDRGAATETAVAAMPSLEQPCTMQEGTDLRWVLLHLINETARHAGHADAVRELLDGTTGE